MNSDLFKEKFDYRSGCLTHNARATAQLNRNIAEGLSIIDHHFAIIIRPRTSFHAGNTRHARHRLFKVPKQPPGADLFYQQRVKRTSQAWGSSLASTR